MKVLLIACSVFALAATTGIANAAPKNPANAYVFSSTASKDCHRIDTNLPNVAHVWVCKSSKLPRWWSWNETDPVFHHSSQQPPPPPPPT